jgi:hypothetical protein
MPLLVGSFSAALNGVVWVRMVARSSMKIQGLQHPDSGVANDGDVLVQP